MVRGLVPRVYPRVCGGTVSIKTPGSVDGGLSPRVRGNPLPPGPRPALGGSIPACAGEPAARPADAGADEVYPRVCGGTPRYPRAGLALQGLSPRVRGNRLPPACRITGAGSIPACAGEPGEPRQAAHPGGVYPRVCGGTLTGRRRARQGQGLSPRVRGNRAGRKEGPGRGRSIPACAGEP